MTEPIEIVKKEKESSIPYRLSIIFMAFSFFLLLGMLFMLYWPVTIIKPLEQPYKIKTPIVEVGGYVVYEVRACKYFDIAGFITRSFEDGALYPAISSSGNVKKGCAKSEVSVAIPNYIPPGVYHINLDASYQVNPIRTIIYHFKTEDFRVKKP